MESTGIRYHDGPTSSRYSEGILRQRAIARSDSSIVLCDHTKFISGGVHQYANWSDCDILITDSIPDSPGAKDLMKQIQGDFLYVDLKSGKNIISRNSKRGCRMRSELLQAATSFYIIIYYQM